MRGPPDRTEGVQCREEGDTLVWERSGEDGWSSSHFSVFLSSCPPPPAPIPLVGKKSLQAKNERLLAGQRDNKAV